MGVEEAKVEKFLAQCVEDRGGMCLKLTGYKGIPDRLVLMPNGKTFFVELKARHGTLSKAQEHMFKLIKATGNYVCVLNSIEQVADMMRGYAYVIQE